MAKKSAKSKGYRKTIKTKPFLTKKEIIALVIIVAALLLGVVLFNAFYDDGFIEAEDVQAGDIVFYGSSEIRDRYFKVGEIGEIEGFTLETDTTEGTAISTYAFIPDAETDNIDSIAVRASYVNASTLANTTVGSMLNYMGDSMTNMPTIQETTIQGYPAYVFCSEYNYYDETLAAEETEAAPAEEAAETEAEAPAEEAAETEAEAEEPASNIYCQNLNAYVQIDDARTLCMYIYRTGEDDSFYMAEDAYIDYVQNYSTAFTAVQPEAK